MEMTYFEEAVDFLISHPQIDAEKGVGVCGISKGAEVGLAMAATISSSKLGAIAVMNGTVYSCMVDLYYKGKLVCEGKSYRVFCISAVPEFYFLNTYLIYIRFVSKG